MDSDPGELLAIANEAALNAWVAAQSKPLTGRALVLLEAARTAAQALDQDVSPCRECGQRGTAALPATLGQYQRTIEALAALLAEEGAEDGEGATVLRLAGG